MRKTLHDLASYLKENMVTKTNGAYAINPAFSYFSVEENIRQGVQAFRDFLVRLYDVLYALYGSS